MKISWLWGAEVAIRNTDYLLKRHELCESPLLPPIMSPNELSSRVRRLADEGSPRTIHWFNRGIYCHNSRSAKKSNKPSEWHGN